MKRRPLRTMSVTFVFGMFAALPAQAEVVLVFFPRDGSEIPAEFDGDVRRAVCLATLLVGMRVEVTGFADGKGSRKANEALSERRASSTAGTLTRYGLTCSRFAKVVGKGSETPSDGNGPFSRRAEITITGAPPTVAAVRACIDGLVPASVDGGWKCPLTP